MSEAVKSIRELTSVGVDELFAVGRTVPIVPLDASRPHAVSIAANPTCARTLPMKTRPELNAMFQIVQRHKIVHPSRLIVR